MGMIQSRDTGANGMTTAVLELVRGHGICLCRKGAVRGEVVSIGTQSMWSVRRKDRVYGYGGKLVIRCGGP